MRDSLSKFFTRLLLWLGLIMVVVAIVMSIIRTLVLIMIAVAFAVIGLTCLWFWAKRTYGTSEKTST